MSHSEKDETYTAVPNEILETMAKAKLNGSQYALILIIWRYTFGFQRCQKELGAGFLAAATGLNVRTVKKELATLHKRQIILTISNGVGRTHTIKINKSV